MLNEHGSILRQIVTTHTRDVIRGINEQLGLPYGYDQTKSNRCDLLTHYVLTRLQNDGLVARRELHIDPEQNWHFLIAHAGMTQDPSDKDLISDLNPWQYRDHGGGILHGSREEVMNALRLNNAPESFVALRGLSTLRNLNHEPINPFKAN